MPVPSEIAHATASFRHNAILLDKALAELPAEDWQACPCEESNPLLWIAGHIVWARSRVLAVLGTSWSRPWLSAFARGSRKDDAGLYPSTEELLLAWQDLKSTLDAALEATTSEQLAAPAPEKSPTFDGKTSGFLSFMANHDSYHVGQAVYVRHWCKSQHPAA